MSTVEVNQIVPLEGLTLVLYADIAFDSAHGPYVLCWEAFYFQSNTRRNWLKTADLGLLTYDEFKVTAEALTQLCDNAIINETVYADLEQMHIDRFQKGG